MSFFYKKHVTLYVSSIVRFLIEFTNIFKNISHVRIATIVKQIRQRSLTTLSNVVTQTNSDRRCRLPVQKCLPAQYEVGQLFFFILNFLDFLDTSLT